MIEDFDNLENLLRQKTILYNSNKQKLRDSSGKQLNWVYYHWNVSLTSEGAKLTFLCILEKLKNFKSKQLASYGMTSLPIVSSFVALSDGEYTGIAIRKERETHGTCRQIEGDIDKSSSVIIIDDSISTAGSISKAISALENEGIQVEGCIILVNFPWNGGVELIKAQGYKIETLFDVRNILGIKSLPFSEQNKNIIPALDKTYRIEDGLSPADVARKAIEYYLKYNLVPTPPNAFDDVYHGEGGIFISLRVKSSNFRIIRDGFYILDHLSSNIYSDLILATYKTVSLAKDIILKYGFDNLKVGVSLLSRHQAILPKDLEFYKFGILVQSKVQPSKIGGILPNTEMFTSEIEQLNCVLYRKAKLARFEPYTLYKHTVVKSIESREKWPSFGQSNIKNEHDVYPDKHFLIGNQLLEYIRLILETLYKNSNSPPPAFIIDYALFVIPVKGIALSFYYKGIRTSSYFFGSKLPEIIFKAVECIWNTNSYAKRRHEITLNEIHIVASLFYNEQYLGDQKLSEVVRKTRLGIDTIHISNGTLKGIMLSYIPCHYDLSKEGVINSLIKKNRIIDERCSCKIYTTSSWLSKDSINYKLVNGYTKKIAAGNAEEKAMKCIDMLCQYIIRQIDPATSIPKYCYLPLQNKWVGQGTTMRTLLALSALQDGAILIGNKSYAEYAQKGLQYIAPLLLINPYTESLSVPALLRTTGDESYLLLALAKHCNYTSFSELQFETAYQKVSSYIHTDGIISPLRNGKHIDADHNFFPGVTLLALSNYLQLSGNKGETFDFNPSLKFYKTRFELIRPWGMMWWHARAWTSIFFLTGEDSNASFVFELADWALQYQLKNGAFLIDYSASGPNFLTSCVMEGLAEAWRLAILVGDDARKGLYQNAWEQGLNFMNNLIVYEEDTYCMPGPNYAIGGVRHSLTNSHMRIDYAAHLLTALVKGVPNIK